METIRIVLWDDQIVENRVVNKKIKKKLIHPKMYSIYKWLRHKVYKHFVPHVTWQYVVRCIGVSPWALKRNISPGEFNVWGKLMPELNEPYLFSCASNVNALLIFFYAMRERHLYCLEAKRHSTPFHNTAKLTDT